MSSPQPEGPADPGRAVRLGGNLGRLESEAIHIIREALTEADNPVLLFSGGKDSTVLAALAARAFWPQLPPMPLLHVDSTFEFDETIEFRNAFAERLGYRLIVEANEEGRLQGINPFTHGSALYTEVMRTQALKAALDRHRFDVVLGGARRDEEKTRAKERVFSIRSANHGWDPRNQRPELWALYNGRLAKGQTVRVFPLSNWTEADIWTYIAARGLPIAPLYFAAERATVEHEGALLVVNDDRYPWKPGEIAVPRRVRFRTVGCWPVTGAIASEADTLAKVLAETLTASTSERQGRLIDRDDGGSLEQKKRDGYF
ncbi:sulfate adenylyltransferase subunit CysD [Prosthecomicrobium sp. N25]|uniref:sulfate adenylyltransferase subunit CysD n=1 Tax=Prosthecomicrobium sp. N25 TaxID=3129254 RepID=UPI003076D687